MGEECAGVGRCVKAPPRPDRIIPPRFYPRKREDRQTGSAEFGAFVAEEGTTRACSGVT